MQAARREVRVRLHESDVQWETSDNEGLRWGGCETRQAGAGKQDARGR